MRKALAGFATAAALLALAGCATVTSAPAGTYKVGAAYTVTLNREWSDVSRMANVHEKGVRVLSIDGPALNRLYLTEGLAPGASLVTSTVKEKPTPVFRSDFSSSETVEFVADSMSALGYLGVQTSNPRPGKFGQADGVRFDLTGRTKEGLDISGTALTSEKDGKLYVILYIAPTEHYYGDALPEVEAIMKSASGVS